MVSAVNVSDHKAEIGKNRPLACEGQISQRQPFNAAAQTPPTNGRAQKYIAFFRSSCGRSSYKVLEAGECAAHTPSVRGGDRDAGVFSRFVMRACVRFALNTRTITHDRYEDRVRPAIETTSATMEMVIGLGMANAHRRRCATQREHKTHAFVRSALSELFDATTGLAVQALS